MSQSGDAGPASDPAITDGRVKHKCKETEHHRLGAEQAADDSSSSITSLPSSIRWASKKAKAMVRKADKALSKAGSAVKKLAQHKKASKSAPTMNMSQGQGLSRTEADNDSLPLLEEAGARDNDNDNEADDGASANTDKDKNTDTEVEAGVSEQMEEAHLDKLAQLWKAAVYAFFTPLPDIEYNDSGHVYHAFRCLNCPHKVSWYPDTADASSTGALR
ncbi:hypothetical protein EV421DRAFT_1743287 [Armillaria borealis]|uniref:Uncharacterized protein n=1 Tax=Armillaria borealis TaxID=47425 RepID=A0AA39IVI9_9AGAR|nr:hypothetical protein EV421DRAFT_1743287 [Armillaria borealis]